MNPVNIQQIEQRKTEKNKNKNSQLKGERSELKETANIIYSVSF